MRHPASTLAGVPGSQRPCGSGEMGSYRVEQETLNVLPMNVGSSSIRFAAYQMGHASKRRLHGKVDRVGSPGTTLMFDVIHARICEGLAFLDIEIDSASNERSEPVISTGTGRVDVRVIRTDEEVMITKAVARILDQEER